MRRPPILRAGLCAALAALPATPPASAAPEPSPAALFVRARAAEVAGDPQSADAGFARLLAHEPASRLVAERAYRQGLNAGDLPLALRAARLLEQAGALPPDGRVLLAIEPVRTRDWKTARAAADALAKDRLFAFATPFLRAWIAFGAHEGDPLAALDGARGLALAQPYLPEQRALLLIATGRMEEGIAVLRSAGSRDIAAWPIRIRLAAADALARAGQTPRALGLLDGDDPALAEARAVLMRDGRLAAPVDSAAAGVAALLVRVAIDLGRQDLAPVGLALARQATFLDPRDAGAWLTCANLLGQLKRPRQAVAALDHVAPDDPFASAARTLRVALLNDLGDQPTALADAVKSTEGRGDLAAWSRLGDLYLAMNRAADAAAAYTRAIAAAKAAGAPAAQLWPIYLQQGGAYDQAGDWPAAKGALRQAQALAPDQPLVLNQLGYSLIAHREDIARGGQLIARASALRPDDPAITDSLGWSRYLLGDVAGAVPVLERASAADPTEPTISEHLGDAYWAAGRFYEARYAWRAALVTADEKDRARVAAKIDLGYTRATASP